MKIKIELEIDTEKDAKEIEDIIAIFKELKDKVELIKQYEASKQ